MKHFAWLTTDTSCLDQGCADVVVLRDEADVKTGESNDVLYSAVTTVDAKDGDHQDAINEAESLLAAGGWEMRGAWEAVTTGYLAEVAHA